MKHGRNVLHFVWWVCMEETQLCYRCQVSPDMLESQNIVTGVLDLAFWHDNQIMSGSIQWLQKQYWKKGKLYQLIKAKRNIKRKGWGSQGWSLSMDGKDCICWQEERCLFVTHNVQERFSHSIRAYADSCCCQRNHPSPLSESVHLSCLEVAPCLEVGWYTPIEYLTLERGVQEWVCIHVLAVSTRHINFWVYKSFWTGALFHVEAAVGHLLCQCTCILWRGRHHSSTLSESVHISCLEVAACCLKLKWQANWGFNSARGISTSCRVSFYTWVWFFHSRYML